MDNIDSLNFNREQLIVIRKLLMEAMDSYQKSVEYYILAEAALSDLKRIVESAKIVK